MRCRIRTSSRAPVVGFATQNYHVKYPSGYETDYQEIELVTLETLLYIIEKSGHGIVLDPLDDGYPGDDTRKYVIEIYDDFRE